MIPQLLAGAAAATALILQAPAPVETIPLDLTGPRPIAMLTLGGGEPVRVIFDTCLIPPASPSG